ncbi:hypothetical protein ACJX0J_013773, partial [Zea mays]
GYKMCIFFFMYFYLKFMININYIIYKKNRYTTLLISLFNILFSMTEDHCYAHIQAVLHGGTVTRNFGARVVCAGYLAREGRSLFVIASTETMDR